MERIERRVDLRRLAPLTPLVALLLAPPLCAGSLAPFFSATTLIEATTTDASNNLYIAGFTTNPNLPVTSGSFTPCAIPGCQRGFVAKITADSALVFATYLDDEIFALAVDSARNVYLAQAAAVVELSSDGTRVLASKQFSGIQIWSIVVAGDIFVAGETNGDGFVATPGAFQTTRQGGDGFVMRLDPTLSKTVYATFLGGAGFDYAWGLAVDGDGAAYVTGATADPALFPTTPGALRQIGPGYDVFLAKLNASGSVLELAALFGPSSVSAGVSIALDSSGIYVAGVTTATGFPLPPNAFSKQGTQFAAKLSLDGSALLYETLLPGEGGASIVPNTQMVVHDGRLVFFGFSDGLVPTTTDSFAPCTSGGPVRFVLELDETGTARTYGSYVPGGLAVRADGQVWYADDTGLLRTFNINDALPAGPRCVADSLNYLATPIAPGKLVSLFGPSIGPEEAASSQLDASGNVSTYLGGLSVYFNGIAAPLLYAGKTQINAVVPFEISGAPASTVVILKDGVELDGPTVPAVATAPVLVTTSEGCIAAVNPDGTVNSADHPAALGSTVAIFGEGIGVIPGASTGGIGQGLAQITNPPGGFVQQSGTGFPGLGPPVTAPVQVVYAGDAPEAVEGVFQLNVKLPDSFATGKQRLNLLGSGCIWIGPRQ